MTKNIDTHRIRKEFHGMECMGSNRHRFFVNSSNSENNSKIYQNLFFANNSQQIR